MAGGDESNGKGTGQPKVFLAAFALGALLLLGSLCYFVWLACRSGGESQPRPLSEEERRKAEHEQLKARMKELHNIEIDQGDEKVNFYLQFVLD